MTFDFAELKSKDNIEIIKELTAKAAEINTSNHVLALQICDSVLYLCKKYNYPQGEAKITRIKGLSKFYAVDYSAALKLFIESKEKYAKLQDTVGMCLCNNNIAVVYNYMDLHDKSLNYHHQNLKIRRKIKDTIGIATTLNNIGVVFRHKHLYDSSLFYYKKALEIELKYHDSVSISRYYNNIALAYMDLKQYDSSQAYFTKSLNIRLNINELQGIKNSYQGLGLLYYNQAKYKEARKMQELSMKYAQQIGIVYEIESISDEIAKTYEKLNLFELAYKYSALNRQMHDSIKFSETTSLITKIELENAYAITTRIKELEAENIIEKERSSKYQLIYLLSAVSIILILIVYSFFKIRKSNILLLEKQEQILMQKEEITQQNESILQQNQELERINSEKDKFFSIIAHDLRSPFAGFLGLTKLMVKNHDELSREDIFETSALLKNSADNLYKLLENLLEWSRIQRGLIDVHPQECLIDFYVDENIQLQSELLKQKEMHLQNNVNQGFVVIADLDMLNTIIRNLLSNAIKFTKRGGNIELNAKVVENNMIEISISDNGIGIDPKNKNSLFKIDQKISTPGTENEASTGLGLLLVKDFVEKNNGKLWFESELDKGTTFYFILPRG